MAAVESPPAQDSPAPPPAGVASDMAGLFYVLWPCVVRERDVNLPFMWNGWWLNLTYVCSS
jgi:hypothetical protein